MALGPHAGLWRFLGRIGGRLHVLLPPPGRRKAPRGRGPRSVDVELSGWSDVARRTQVLRVTVDREALAGGGLELVMALGAAWWRLEGQRP